MDLTDREKDSVQALIGTAKSAASLVPGLGQAIAGYDAYKKNSFDRQVQKVIQFLSEKVENLEEFSKQEWLQTEDGQQFARKVCDCAFDAQLEDKQELFVNALVNGTTNQDCSNLEKLKFVDMIRHLSRASLIVLSEMHTMFAEQVHGPGRTPDPNLGFAQVDPTNIAEKLAEKYDPYLVTSAISEMEGQGLFSRTGEWRKDATGRHHPGGGFSTAICYTDFAARFVEFITVNPMRQVES